LGSQKLRHNGQLAFESGATSESGGTPPRRNVELHAPAGDARNGEYSSAKIYDSPQILNLPPQIEIRKRPLLSPRIALMSGRWRASKNAGGSSPMIAATSGPALVVSGRL